MSQHSDDPTDQDLDRLLTPGAHLSRMEQDAVFDDVMQAVNASPAAATTSASSRAESFWSGGWLAPLGMAGALSAGLFMWMGQHPATTTGGQGELVARGAAAVQLRCNKEKAVFLDAGVHHVPTCKGQLELRTSTATPTHLAAGVATAARDLRWVAPVGKAPSHEQRTRALALRARGDERVFWVHLQREAVDKDAVQQKWGVDVDKHLASVGAADHMVVVVHNSAPTLKTAPAPKAGTP